jgi:hypothetical protein
MIWFITLDDDEQDPSDDDEVDEDGEEISHARTAPCFLTSASEPAVTLDESGMK